MLPKLLYKKNFILILFVTFLLSTIFFYLVFEQLNSHHINNQKQQENLLLYESISLFKTMVYTRQWNAEHGGVYVKQKDGLLPNPYLKENLIKIDSNASLIKINPAWMTRQISDLINEDSHRYYKITSLNPLNPNNIPDEFEGEALHYFEKYPNEKYYYKNNMEELSKTSSPKESSAKMYNFMGRLNTDKACLQCHAVQGYKEGDTRGGIRVSIPVEKYQEAILIEDKRHMFNVYMVVTFMMIISILIFSIIYIFIKEQKKLEEFNAILEKRVDERTKSLNDLNEKLEKKVATEVAKSKQKDSFIITQSRHAAMGEMISMIAHQWRQPLSTIAMDANNMMIDIELDNIDKNTFKEYAEGIYEQTDYLSKTIDVFRNFFRQEKEKVITLPSKIVQECFEIVGASLKAHEIEYKLVCESEKERNMHSRELLQVILNLINNAKDILIEHETKNPYISVTINHQNDITTIKVCDNGIGISKDAIPHLFEPYFTTKDKKNGTGLGLYMSKMIIETNFNGNISFSSGNNQTCFCVKF